MPDYKLNPPPPIEVNKKDFINLCLKLDSIRSKIIQAQRSIPYGPGNIVIKQRLKYADDSLIELIAFLVSEYNE
jgi:hypothetical protein